MTLLPSLSSVTQSDNTSFLPASAPSQQAAQLASPLQVASLTAVTVVTADPGRTMTAADRNNAVGLARARTDYYAKPPFLNRNEFGVSAGGPVYIPKVYNGKNKTFWFFSY